MDHNIRLSKNKINKIKESILSYFKDRDVKIYIFGSRANLSKKGGDVDILVKLTTPLSDEEKFRAKLKILFDLYKVLGERKIDLLIVNKPEKEIEKIAIKEGVEI